MRIHHRWHWTFVLGLAMAFPAASSAGPELYSIEPESGPAGTPIAMKGKGLATTGRVAFAIGRTIKLARFKVVSDQEVRVLAPECYRPGAAATVAIFTEQGVAVAMPATVQTIRSPIQGTNVAESGESFYHVLGGGILNTAGGVAVIEKGGVVVQSNEPAMQFVKSGGTLLEFHNANGLVFYEQAAQLGPGVVKRNQPAPVTLVRIPEITACPGIGPFRFQAPLAPDLSDAPAVPPLIRGFLRACGPTRRDHHAHRQGVRSNKRGPLPRPKRRLTRGRVPHRLGSRAQGGSSGGGSHDHAAAPDRRNHPGTGGHRPAEPDNSPDRPCPLSARCGEGAPCPLLDRFRRNGQFHGQPIGLRFPRRTGDAGRSEPPVLRSARRAARRFGRKSKRRLFEPGAILPDRFKRAPIGQPVPVIVPSPVDQTFVIVRAPDVRR